MKKRLIMILALSIGLISLLIGTTLANSDNIYTVCIGSGSGEYATLDDAISAINAAYASDSSITGGKIVLKMDVTAVTSTTRTLPECSVPLCVTSSDANNRCKIIVNTHTAKRSLYFSTPITFHNIIFQTGSSSNAELWSGKALTIGENVSFFNENGTVSALDKWSIRCGFANATMESVSLTINSGSLAMIHCGNTKGVGDVNVTIGEGVAITQFLQCGGTSTSTAEIASGRVNLTVNGATIEKLYLNGYGPTPISSVNAVIANSTILDGISYNRNGNTPTTGGVSLTLDNTSVAGAVDAIPSQAGTAALAVKNSEYLTLDTSLSGWDNIALTNSTVEITTTYAGPTAAGSVSIDSGSKLLVPENTSYPNISGIEQVGALEVVYLSGEVTTSGSGSTPATAVKTLAEAYARLGSSGGTIVLCGDLTETFAAKSFTVYGDKPVTITSKYGSADYTDKVYTLHNEGTGRAVLQFTAATIFQDITLNETASNDKAIEFFTGPSLTFGENVVCTYNGGEIDESSDGRFAVRVGYYDKDYTAAAPATFTMQSGTVSFIQGGNNLYHVSYSKIVLSGTAKVTLMVQGGGTNKNVTDSVIEIKDRTFVPVLYCGGYGSAETGSSLITVSGGKVDMIRAARSKTLYGDKADSTGSLGSVTLMIHDTARIGGIDLNSAAITTLSGTQTLSLGDNLLAQTLSCGFGSGWDTIGIGENNMIYLNAKYDAGSAAVTVGKNSTVLLSNQHNTAAPTNYTGLGSGDSKGKIILFSAPNHAHTGKNYEISQLITMNDYAGSGLQGTAVFGDYLFQADKYGLISVYDLSAADPNAIVTSFKLATYNKATLPSDPTVAAGTEADEWSNHTNQLMFSDIYFDDSDPFPLAYITTGNSGNHDGTGAYIVKCAVERIRIKKDGTWYSELVQLIEINDKDNIPLGEGDHINGPLVKMYSDGNGRFLYTSGNGYDASKGYEKIGWGFPAAHVDTDPTDVTRGKFYVKSARYRTKEADELANQELYGIKDYYTDSAYIITEFDLPALPASESDPTYGKTVTLYPRDITDQFITPYTIGFTQGGVLYQGRIYYSFGCMYAITVSGKYTEASTDYLRNGIQIFDIAEKRIVAKLEINAETIEHEPECTAIWNGKLLLSTNRKVMFQFDMFMTDELAVDSTCAEHGNIAYSKCSACDLYYSTEDHKTILPDISKPLASHNATHIPYRAPGEETPGNIAYWFCSACGKYFSDSECLHQITQAETVIPPTGPTILWGDADKNGEVTAQDAVAIKSYRAGLTEGSDLNLDACDLDGNGKVDAYDAYLIQLFVAEQIDRFPRQN